MLRFLPHALCSLAAALSLAAFPPPSASGPSQAESSVSESEIAGTWIAYPTHGGGKTRLVLRFDEANGKGLRATWSTPVLHIWSLPLGEARIERDRVTIPAIGFSLRYDRSSATLNGFLPSAFVPVYSIPITYRRSPPVEPPDRPEPAAPVARPLWEFDAGTPIWSDVLFVDGTVIFGDDGGLVHALDARSGRPRWQLQTGGAVRARPAISNGSVFVQSDDGNLYKLNARTGRKEWSVRVMEKPFERPSMDDKKTRYENFASAVTISDGQLYLGTHDGHVLALDPADGSRRWDFAARDSVVSTPLAAGRRIYFGSFDGFVYALDAGSGALVWKYDTGSPVTSSPAFAGGRVIVGSRSYDLFALDAGTGRPAWERYSWFSWVESPATVFRGSVYIGSSDAAKVSALDALSGRRLWETDVLGDAWAQPAVTDRKVFMGSVGAVHYMVPLRATILAMDRRTGRPRWRFPTNPPPNPPAGTTSYGFASSPALGDGRVFFAGLDGRLRAFRQ